MQQCLDDMVTGIRAARAAGADVNVFLHETSRSNMAHTLAAVQAAEREGATAVTLVDSHSSARPATIGYLVRQIRAVSGVKIEAHCHNDFGMSVANVLAAYEAGATALNVTVNGIGYRAGNASLETVVMALEALYGIDTGIRLDMLPELSRLVEEITGIAVGHFQPVVGRGAFNYEQFGSVAALTEAGKHYHGLPYAPEVIGRSLHLVIGKWSDNAAVIQKLAEYGMSAQPAEVDRIRLRSQRMAVGHHRPLTDDEFLVLAEQEGAQSCASVFWQVGSL
jgi:isopropylmalate/homocitrate/citramalate synthase